MSDVERWREAISALPSPEAWKAKEEAGWRPVAIEWERLSGTSGKPSDGARPVPYGLRISADCTHLEVDPVEKQVMTFIVAMIAGDHSLSRIAFELNQKGYRRRDGAEWTQVNIFQMLPRVIEFAPEILAKDEWSASKRRLLETVG